MFFRHFLIARSLMAANDGGGGAGGGPAFDPAAFEEKMNATVANIITAKLSAFDKKWKDGISTSVSELLSKALDDKLKDFKPGVDPGDGGNKGKKDVEIET